MNMERISRKRKNMTMMFTIEKYLSYWDCTKRSLKSLAKNIHGMMMTMYTMNRALLERMVCRVSLMVDCEEKALLLFLRSDTVDSLLFLLKLMMLLL